MEAHDLKLLGERIRGEMMKCPLVKEFTFNEAKVLHFILFATYGCGRKLCYIPNACFEEWTGIEEKNVIPILRRLDDERWISRPDSWVYEFGLAKYELVKGMVAKERHGELERAIAQSDPDAPMHVRKHYAQAWRELFPRGRDLHDGLSEALSSGRQDSLVLENSTNDFRGREAGNEAVLKNSTGSPRAPGGLLQEFEAVCDAESRRSNEAVLKSSTFKAEYSVNTDCIRTLKKESECRLLSTPARDGGLADSPPAMSADGRLDPNAPLLEQIWALQGKDRNPQFDGFWILRCRDSEDAVRETISRMNDEIRTRGRPKDVGQRMGYHFSQTTWWKRMKDSLMQGAKRLSMLVGGMLS